jgi:hypothetical protein
MKDTFMNKIGELNEELADTKVDSNKKIFELQQDLSETKQIKDLFVKKIIAEEIKSMKQS